jgi:hypothetical protein
MEIPFSSSSGHLWIQFKQTQRLDPSVLSLSVAFLPLALCFGRVHSTFISTFFCYFYVRFADAL